GGLPSISGITKHPFVCQSPRHSSPLEDSAFWVHFTRGDGRLPRCGHHPRIPRTHIPIPSISPQPCNPTSAPTHPYYPPRSTFFSFRGVSEYMEDFISRVDAPLLNKVSIHIFHQLSWTFTTRPVHRSHRGLSAYMIADVVLDDRYPSIKLSLSQDARKHRGPSIELSTQCAGSDWQVSFLVQACGLLLRTLSAVDTLTVHESDYRLAT
ncbi:hypothetical protein BJV74DRAFT_869313, partial [Russula compacta]